MTSSFQCLEERALHDYQGNAASGKAPILRNKWHALLTCLNLRREVVEYFVVACSALIARLLSDYIPES
ncbi:MAG: hypothetical protein WC485_10255 [Opitutaceae bacterium]